MRTSTTIGQISKALLQAQAKLGAPKKVKPGQVGNQKYLYADLAEVKETYRAPLAEAGLLILHALQETEGHMVLTTTLLHGESGEWFASDYSIAAYAKPQEQGSAITYAKRYNSCALLDLAAEDDDDGAAAQAAASKKKADRAEPKPPVEMPKAPASDGETLTAEEVEKVFKEAKRVGYQKPSELKQFTEPMFGVESVRQVPRSGFERLLRAIAPEPVVAQ